MAAYAALVSLMYIIKQIEHHPSPPVSLDETQVESLTQNIIILQQFLECYSQAAGYSKEADPLEMRIADMAYAAEDVIESHIVDRILTTRSTSHDDDDDEEINSEKENSSGEEISSIDLYGGLQKVIEEMESLKKEVMEIKEKMSIQHQLQRDSSISATSLGSVSTGHNNTVVGFDDVLIEVMDKLTGGESDRQVIPIVGMGGIGKTTLARSIYQNQVVAQHFDILVWANVSQDYRMKEILSELMEEGRGGSSHKDEYEMGDQLHKRLSGRRYLIIMDDIWDVEPWDQLRRFLPDNRNGSRIVITTRISNFQLTDSYVLKMEFLDEDKSWSLFSKIVFGEEGCPLELEEIGKKIVGNCRGLPLPIVVVGGLLVKSKHSREYWGYIAENLNAVVNSEDDENCLKILHMSYNKLPVYLKPCFLYMGVFSRDRKIYVSKLVKLWVAEGFLKPISGKSLEETAYIYICELVQRNLILVHGFRCIGSIKYCTVHDLLRDLSLREAQKERFYSFIRHHSLDFQQSTSTQRRVVIPESTSQEEARNALQSMSFCRSLICDIEGVLPPGNSRLLRVMSYLRFDNTCFLEKMFGLVNLRYLAVSVHLYSRFPSSVCFLWNLHTLVVDNFVEETAPAEIWKMPLLRHLEFVGELSLPDPPSSNEDSIVLRNLQTLGRIKDFKCCEEVVKRIPNIEKLKLKYSSEKFEEGCLNKFDHLYKLKSFDCQTDPRAGDILRKLTFPHSLKKLTLEANKHVYWDDMLEKIGSLSFLQKLKLKNGSFRGRRWETVEDRFPSLRFFQIEQCKDLEYWTVESSHFPRLEHIFLRGLVNLKEIPLEVGEITTLQSIELVLCSNSAVISAKMIQGEQEELYGEVSLQVRVWCKDYELDDGLRGLASPNFKIV